MKDTGCDIDTLRAPDKFFILITNRYPTLYTLQTNLPESWPFTPYFLVMVTVAPPVLVPELVPPVQVEAAMEAQEYVFVRPKL